MKKLFIFLFIVVPFVLFSQVQQPAQNRQSTVGQLQNNTGQVQSKGFQAPPPPQAPPPTPGSGSKVKPNPFMQTADFAIMQNPTYEKGFRTGFSYGFAKTNKFGTSSFGANGLFTTDFTQRAVSVYKSFYSKWFYSYNFAQIGKNQTNGASITRLWNKDNRTVGLQLGYSIIDGESFRIASPSLVAFINKQYTIDRFSITPELYTTFSNPYYDRDKKSWEKDFTFNALAGASLSYKFTKRFQLNFTYRGNINTNPKFGLMNNILLGTNFKF